MLVPLEESLIECIMEIDEDDPYPKQGNSVPDHLALTTSFTDLLWCWPLRHDGLW
jgi:hypothetical protein